MKRTIYSSIAIACALLVSACGGGGDDTPTNSNVTIYGHCGNSPIYAAADVVLLRWKQFPLTVFIDYTNAPSINVGNNREIYTRALQTGVVGWTAAGNGLGAIRFVTTPIDADITVKFGDAQAANMAQGKPYTPGLAGVTIFKRDGNFPNSYIIKGTTITLDVAEFTDKITWTGINYEEYLGLVTLHEMGHALFAAGHPKNSVSAMSPAVPFNTKPVLSQLDMNSIREAYCKAL